MYNKTKIIEKSNSENNVTSITNNSAKQFSENMQNVRVTTSNIIANDSMRRMAETMGNLQTTMADIPFSDNARQFAESMHSVRATTFNITANDSIRRMAEAMGNLQTTMADIPFSDSARQLAETMQSVRATTFNITTNDSIRRMAEAMGNLQTTMADIPFSDSARQFAETIQSVRATTFNITVNDSIRPTLLAAEDLYKSIINSTATPINAQSTEQTGEKVASSQLFSNDNAETTELGSILNNKNHKYFTLANKLQSIIENIENLFNLEKNQLLKEFKSFAIGKAYELIFLILTYSIVIPMYTNTILNQSSSIDTALNLTDSNTLEKDYLKKREVHIREQYELQLNSICLVIKNVDVYQSNKTKSNKIGNLSIGDEVTILQKKRHWTKVSWIDKENEVALVGWVFTRYLKPIF